MSNPRPPRQPCWDFSRGRCKFGARCKFSHDLTPPAKNEFTGSSTVRDRQRPSPSGRREDKLQEWKQVLRQGRYSTNRATSDRFFQLALELVGGDLSECQEVVKLLSGEDGLNHIRLLAEKHVPSAVDNHSKQDLWTKQMQPLFTLITHQRVVDSAVLEQQVAAIYNFIQGVASRRMKIIFDFVIGLAHSASVTNTLVTTASSPISKLAIVEICLAVLSKMVDCNTTNIIDQTFRAVTQQVSSILKGMGTTSSDYLLLQSHKWLRYINCRLGVGDELASPQAPATGTIRSRAKFTLPKNLPGHLSASGRRHDNDHANIADISILPTHQEVKSDRAEYLPSNDPSSFHLPGIRGRLDREFRLLREDTVGQLRDAVRDLLEMIRSRGQAQQSRPRERQNLFTYIYEDVKPVGASFEQVHGLDLCVMFPQPRSNTRLKRREWWTQSKRLQPGALVCIINEDGSVIFCVVAETTTITGDQKSKEYQHTNIPEEKSKEKRPSLAEDEEFAYVHLNLAELKEDSMQQALRWYQHVGPQRRACLVEFPGVLLAAFQHTLEALQMMSRTPDVPFIDLLAPVTPTAGIVKIPPPQYTTKADFYFDLQCLAKDNTNLRLSPTQHLDPRTLTKHSTLDKTQSSALLDSLSRSLALIQGPPGTGKSYTGEKIIKVLLANKLKGNLGPILCVCYKYQTNHALDQLLEHLLDDGVKQIIRIGSRSKSERLESVNLRAVARSATREEAGEVLEAHNLTALLPSIEHCILIGDHLQLRPQIQNYDLSSANPRGIHYSLDVSLFERLVRPPQDESQRLPFSTLDTQRRMHPSISELIRQTLYPSLINGGDVATYPEVLGMKKRLFWLQHSMPEDREQQQDPTSNSHTNSFEVDMTVALVQHLVRQGAYGPDDIAVITPYLGQLHRLHRVMQASFQISVGDKDLEELSALDASKVGQQDESPARAANTPVRTTLLKSVRLATVDNFQGEEAKVVVISLVRSNQQRRCGFLNTPNRINVLLSRAKHGMYIISNSDTYEHIQMWADVITMLRDKDNIGPTLELQCPRHPYPPIEVSTPDHFLQFSPEGGCLQHCDQRLSCGHACINRCHSQVLHNASQDLSSITCKELVVKTVPGCNHAVKVQCNVDVTTSNYTCISPCGDPQSCPSLCGEACPDPKYCQICGDDAIKSTMVDFIMGMQYHEIDLDEDPCIFPDCGHFITKTNMDGIMDLKAHYEMSADFDSCPVALSSSSTPFSMDEVKTCPSCRGSLRNIARYGRIIRRATLDEATKKFISWSHNAFLKLADRLVGEQARLEKEPAPAATTQQHQPQTGPGTLLLSRGRRQQLNKISDWVGNSRYKNVLRLWGEISTFIGQVRKEEQPLQRVADHVRHATTQRKTTTGAFAFDESALQVKGVLQASALLLRP
ncbi:hypothetical protein ONZ43_g5975 [Nemania bipapillata]|uniref:Uncharacterized protein n=1 Tax=Nemania bipapillata TaxID=110536 RepID=A0ACC2I4K0_9PEZI|nr:hypothetical protein ONZ43_g5975 [Nemania bipapillata]